MSANSPGSRLQETTRLITAGRSVTHPYQIVSPPVFHASTVLFDSMAAMEAAAKDPFDSFFYGRLGTPTTFAFEQAMAAAEGGFRSVATASGLAAIAAVFTAFASAGDHVLVVDTIYDPARRYCNRILSRMGVEVEYYDPMIGAGIAELLRKNTKLVYLESPGSQTFEVQDVPAIAAAAQAAGAVVALDNTWASPFFFKPFAAGVDVAIQSATKYVVGHSDAMLGVVTTTEATFQAVRTTAQDLGACAGSDECFLGLRGLRTLALRMARHYENGLALARWLEARPEVARVLHPAMPDHPGHLHWKRDFQGASGLFGVVLHPCSATAVTALVDSLELFGIGFSWGGFESLVLPTHPERARSATAWNPGGPTLRFHAGHEDIDDLTRDLARGFAHFAAAN